MTLAEQWPALRTVATHVQSGHPLRVVGNTWQYSSLPVCLNILSNLAQTDVAGRTPPQPRPPATWMLLNPVPGCGFLRIADTTNPAAPQDIPVER